MPQVTIDGVALEDPTGRWWVSDDTPETSVPSLLLSTVIMPGALGELDAPGPTYGAAEWPLVVSYAGGSYDQAMINRATLEATILTRHRLLGVVMSTASWSRGCSALIAGAEATRRSSGRRMDVAYRLRIPAGRWYDTTETTVVLDAENRVSGTQADGTYLLAPLLGGSRDMDPTITATGYGTSTDITVTDVESGQWVRVAGNITPGVSFAIDPIALTVTGGLSGLLDFSPREFHLSPAATVRVQQNGPNPVSITARRAYT